MSTMSSAAISSTAATSTAAASSASKSLVNKDEFLQILVAQLKNQDPLKPTDANAFVTELAQLSQVESLKNMETSLGSILNAARNGNTGPWVSAIGGYMQVNDTSVSTGDKVVLVPSEYYDQITLTLRDTTASHAKKEVNLGPTDSLVFGDITKDYTIDSVKATRNGKAVECSYEVYRVIQGIQQGDSGTLLVAGDNKTYSTSEIKTVTK